MKQCYEMPEVDVIILRQEETFCASGEVETRDVSLGYGGFNEEQEW